MTKKELFDEIGTHLLQDEKPSEYLETLVDNPVFREPPFKSLYGLVNTEQSPKYHPEGTAWVHTLMVVDEAAKVKEKSSDPYCFMWASFLHDIGKPQTTALRHGRITSYGHDEAGAKIARELLQEFLTDSKQVDQIVSLVEYHMHILYVVKDLPFARTKQMKKEANIDDIALLGWCDRMGRTNANPKEERQAIRQFYEKASKK